MAAIEIFQELGDKNHEAQCWSHIAHARVFGDLNETWQDAAEKALQLHKECNMPKWEAYDLYMFAYWYNMKEDWDEVIRYGEESMAMFQDLNNTKGYPAEALHMVYKAYIELGE